MSRYTLDEPPKPSWQTLHRPSCPHYWDERSVSPARADELRKERRERERWWWQKRVNGSARPHE